MNKEIDKKLRDILIARELMSPERLDLCFKESNASILSLSEIIEKFGFIKKDEMRNIIETYIPEAMIGRNEKNKKLTSQFLAKTQTIDKGIVGDIQYISTLNKEPRKICKEVEKITGLTAKLISVPRSEILEGLIENKTIVENKIKDIMQEEDVNVILSTIIQEALEKRASDIHLLPNEDTIHVRYRIDGMIHTIHVLKKENAGKLYPRIKGLTNMDIAQTRIPQDGSFTHYQDGKQIDCRVAIIPCNSGEKLVMRLLRKESVYKDIHELGITNINEWIQLTNMVNGIILVCGPTGSGKSTTLFNTVQIMDFMHKAIYSFEDPIEYTFDLISQTQRNKSVGLDFKDCIRAYVRQDPDIVLVGEIRDIDTADTSMAIADTGHLVYATLHANNVMSAITRLEDLGVDMNKLSYILRGILVQSLARKLCPVCSNKLPQKKTCEYCTETGYYDRTLITEFVKIDSREDFMKLRKNEFPYYTYAEDALVKAEDGITDCEELSRVTNHEFKFCKGDKCIRGVDKCERGKK